MSEDTDRSGAERSFAEHNDVRLTEQLVVQETKATRSDIDRLIKMHRKKGFNLSVAGAVRLCIRRSLPDLLEEATPISPAAGNLAS